MPINKGTGDTPNFLATSKAMGAIISTVATFSATADIAPERTQMASKAKLTIFNLFTIDIARKAGASERIKSSAKTIVPQKMPRTFRFIEANAWRGDIALPMISSRAPAQIINN